MSDQKPCPVCGKQVEGAHTCRRKKPSDRLERIKFEAYHCWGGAGASLDETRWLIAECERLRHRECSLLEERLHYHRKYANEIGLLRSYLFKISVYMGDVWCSELAQEALDEVGSYHFLDNLEAENTRLRDENKFWKETYSNAPLHEVKGRLEKNRRLREALRFYADQDNWWWQPGDSNKTCNIITDSDICREIDHDGCGGKRAREALGEKDD